MSKVRNLKQTKCLKISICCRYRDRDRDRDRYFDR
jgi:hypothetical protein